MVFLKILWFVASRFFAYGFMPFFYLAYTHQMKIQNNGWIFLFAAAIYILFTIYNIYVAIRLLRDLVQTVSGIYHS